MPKFKITINEFWSGEAIIEAENFKQACSGNFPGFDDIECEYVSCEIDEVLPCCKFCEEPIESTDYHSHQDGIVCQNCWDERLRVTS